MIAKLDPLPEKKNPLLAAVLGFLFGPIGVGIYFRSWMDGLVCMGVFLFLAMTGILAIPGWWFAAGYGVVRAVNSNKQREAMLKRQQLGTSVPPVIGVQPPPLIRVHH